MIATHTALFLFQFVPFQIDSWKAALPYFYLHFLKHFRKNHFQNLFITFVVNKWKKQDSILLLTSLLKNLLHFSPSQLLHISVLVTKLQIERCYLNLDLILVVRGNVDLGTSFILLEYFTFLYFFSLNQRHTSFRTDSVAQFLFFWISFYEWLKINWFL